MSNIQVSGPSISRIEWSDVYFTACAERESFNDVSIVTAKSEYAELAFQAAADIVLKTARGISRNDVFEVAQYIMDNGKIHAQEHVRVNDTGITVCINATSVDNEDVVWRALDMLADALQYLDGQHGTVYFGDRLYFTSSEIQLATTH